MNTPTLSEPMKLLKEIFELQSKIFEIDMKMNLIRFEKALAKQLLDFLPKTELKGDLNDY